MIIFSQHLLHRTKGRWSPTNPGSASLEPGFAQAPVQDADTQAHYQMHPAPGLVCSNRPASFPLIRGYEHLFLLQLISPDGEPWWNPRSTPDSQTGRSSLTPGPVLVLACPGLRSAPLLGYVSVWPDSPSGNTICVFFHGKVSLVANPCLLFDRALRFCWQPSSLHLGRICPRVQSYLVLPQAWVSPYQCLHMLPSFGQDVASVVPFSGRLASLPLLPSYNNN